MIDARTVEDLIERGRLSLVRSAGDDAAAKQVINTAADWLLARSRELRAP